MGETMKSYKLDENVPENLDEQSINSQDSDNEPGYVRLYQNYQIQTILLQKHALFS